MVKYIYLFIMVFICTSCGFFIVPKHVKQNFTYCYDGIDTGIDSLINIEGYYDFISKSCQSCYTRVMFYKDGTYVASSTYPRAGIIWFDEKWIAVFPIIGMIISSISFSLKKPFHVRSEERRVGKECRSRWSPYH